LAVGRKYERDIDMLLAEEFSVSPAFAAWFLTNTRFSGVAARVLDVYVSKSDSTGESDLVIVFEEVNGNSRFALLIEDKIDAPLQPEQAARYQQRGQAESLRGDYGAYETILCSPKSYPADQLKTELFDRFVSYEAISQFLNDHDQTPHGAYRAQFISSATSRTVNAWYKIDDDVTNAFWAAAYNMATREFPILEMKELRPLSS
jgi:hypothetical protein